MNIPDTFAFAPLQMIVIGQLLLYCYVTNAEDADRNFPIYQPLLGFAVGLAGMIHETCPVPLVRGINDFMLTAESSPRECRISAFAHASVQLKLCINC